MVNLMLVGGLVCIDPRFVDEASAKDRQAADTALSWAQQKRLGMWSLSLPMCGYEFRKEKASQKRD